MNGRSRLLRRAPVSRAHAGQSVHQGDARVRARLMLDSAERFRQIVLPCRRIERAGYDIAVKGNFSADGQRQRTDITGRLG